jgi:spore maturation protein CgeB
VGPVHAEKRWCNQKKEERRRYGSVINEFPFGSGQYYMVKALKKLEHKVDVFYSTQSVLINEYLTCALYRSLPNFPVKAFLHGLIYKNVPLELSFDVRLRNLRLLEKAHEFDYDLILVSGGNLIFPSTIKELKKNAPIGLLYGATPVYFTRNIKLCARLYDYIFVNQLITECALKSYGGNVKLLPIAACDPDVHNTIKLSEEDEYLYGNDVCFVGRPYDHREKILNNLVDFDLGLWGAGWDKLKTGQKWIENCYRGTAFVEKWVKIYNGSKISLNIFGPGDTSGINMRLFEASACGILQIVEYRSSIQKFFEIGEEIVCFKNINELRRLTKYYLEHPEKRFRIAENGKRRAHSSHTYEERMKKIIVSLENAF